jgi:hypothetical protein
MWWCTVYWCCVGMVSRDLTGALLRCKVTLCNNVLAVSLKNFFLQLLKKHFWVWGRGEKIRGELILHAFQWLPTCIGLEGKKILYI